MNGDIYFLNENTVFKSSDNGNSWFVTPGTSGIRKSRNILIDSKGYAYIGTEGHGIFGSMNPIASPDHATSVNNTSFKNEDKITLYQNYPNPVNSNTKIIYGLNENVFVDLRLYDCLGKTLMILVNEYQGL